METLSELEQRMVEDCDKLDKVILSCDSKEHLKGAFKYYNLWKKKYEFWLEKVNNASFRYREGKAIGMFKAKIQIYGTGAIPTI